MSDSSTAGLIAGSVTMSIVIVILVGLLIVVTVVLLYYITKRYCSRLFCHGYLTILKLLLNRNVNNEDNVYKLTSIKRSESERSEKDIELYKYK